ncbi:translation initiation factor eIF-2B subunit beta [Ctenocephalides felis]|uniref:translation initiation factor eIF-2B subunit beta n=1 Tax=Ctenocephalides felis TaxID=7515 RepID=UPI000E6E4E26|nr:translation initiation factor eIF-2B subunit beta [Ctenocephalides felis]
MTPLTDADCASKTFDLIRNIQIGKIKGSFDITINTVALFKSFIESYNWKSANELITLVSREGKVLATALPQESVTSNMARRVLKIIREEYDTAHKSRAEGQEGDTQASLHKLVTQTSEGYGLVDYSKPQDGLCDAILDHIAEFEIELETSGENIYMQAAEHIHSSEIILTVGYSLTVEKFLKKAAQTRKFEVIVAECAPQNKGHLLAASLAKSKIQTTVISDAAIFAIMSRCNKVIIGTHSVLATGGLRAVCGSHSVALAARHFSVPVIVLAPLYKLTPLYLCSQESDCFNILENPAGTLPYNIGGVTRAVKVYNPVFDYVPPELVTLFITNSGGNSPSYIYRLLSELYHPQDYTLQDNNIQNVKLVL